MKINEIQSVDKAAIRKLLVKHFKLTDNVTIDENGFVSTRGSVVLTISHKVNKLPVKFLHVGSYFSCSNNELTTLDGCPRIIDNNFTCSNNQLTSLEGGPEVVGENYYCTNNQLTSLEGSPIQVGNNFNCGYNQLTSLERGPKLVNGNYSCNNNPLVSLAGIPDHMNSLFLTYDPQLPLMRALVANRIDFNFAVSSMKIRIAHLLNKYAGQGKAGMMKCSSELLTLGKELGLDLRQNARW